MMKRFLSSLILLVTLYGCIGVDEVEDPIVGESITLNTYHDALLVGNSIQLQARYFDQYGIEQDVQVNWQSENESVCTVDIGGKVNALSAGQSEIYASVGNIVSQPVLITVVNSEDDIAMVLISSPAGNQIGVGQEVQLVLQTLNVNGEPVSGTNTSWESADEGVLTVDETGRLEGVSAGFTTVRAQVDNVYSNALGISVGETSRSGVFQGANGYNASGSCELYIDDSGDLKLRLNADFSTDFALGTFIYLANSTSGGTVASSGLELQEITTGGMATFNISNINTQTGLNDYDYVIVLCKPASITFGYAHLD